MPSTNKTIRGLSLWVEDDVPVMEDFNEDNQVLDSLLADLEEDIETGRRGIEELGERFTGGKAKEALRAQQAERAANGVTNRPFSVTPAMWAEGGDLITHPYQAMIPVQGLLPTDDALVLFALPSITAARDAGITDGLGKTVAGAVVVYAEQKPAGTLTGTISVIRREGL